MTEDHRPLSVRDYTVGWIAALPIELAAATVLLDEDHPLPDDFRTDINDENLYRFGRIGSHNVIITCLAAGRIGEVAAAWAAARLVNTFPSLKVGLMVGIGGGVPSDAADIRLGDVVVGLPSGQSPGVVQYDLGKQTSAGFMRTGALNSPPALLLAAVNHLRARELVGPGTLQQHLSVYSALARDVFSREKAGEDVLFGPDGNPTQRAPRPSSDPVCHYGTIASGNSVMKDSATRDRLSGELGGIMCFEMEAAGIMNDFPCLVVRGICDYSDAHKHKHWQPYAAAVAAAYTKSLLSMIPPTSMDRATGISESMGESTPLASGSQAFNNIHAEAESPILYGGPRRSGQRKSVRGVIKPSETDTPVEHEAVKEALEEPLPEPSEEEIEERNSKILQRLKDLPRSRAGFTLFDRTVHHFYGEVYLGNGNVMRSVINNQNGTIRNVGGPMNLGNVGRSIRSGNSVVRGARGYATGAYQSMIGLKPLRKVTNFGLFKWFKGRF